MKILSYVTITLGTAFLALTACSPLDDDGVWKDSLTAVLDWSDVDENGLRPKDAGNVTLYVYPKQKQLQAMTYPMIDEHLSLQLPVGKFSVMALTEKTGNYIQGDINFQETVITLPVKEGKNGLEISSMPESQLYAGFTDNVNSLADKQVMSDIKMLPVFKRMDVTLLVRDSLEYKGTADISLSGMTTALKLNAQNAETPATATGRLALHREQVETDGKDILASYKGALLFPDYVAKDNMLTVTLEEKGKRQDYFKDITEFLESQRSKEIIIILTLDKRTGEINGRAYTEGDIDEMNIYF